MFCTQCGSELQPQDRHCCQCGKETGAVTESRLPAQPIRRLTLSRRDKKIAGVCAGLAHYLGIDVTLMRVIWLVLIFIPPGIGLVGYLLAWLVMPHEDDAAPIAGTSAVAR
jgi:phage shock protein C